MMKPKRSLLTQSSASNWRPRSLFSQSAEAVRKTNGMRPNRGAVETLQHLEPGHVGHADVAQNQIGRRPHDRHQPSGPLQAVLT
jgi:hypothetical protein